MVKAESKTIILPGYSPHNRDWANEMKEKMDMPYVLVHEWGHWVSGGFSLDKELERIIGEIGEVGGVGVNILAKSVGTSVAMNLVRKVPNLLKKLVLCGIPIVGFSEERKELFINNLDHFPASNLIVFQNTKDPLGSFEKVSNFIYSINPKIQVIKKPRSDHNYPYPTDFREFLSG